MARSRAVLSQAIFAGEAIRAWGDVGADAARGDALSWRVRIPLSPPLGVRVAGARERGSFPLTSTTLKGSQ